MITSELFISLSCDLRCHGQERASSGQQDEFGIYQRAWVQILKPMVASSSIPGKPELTGDKKRKRRSTDEVNRHSFGADIAWPNARAGGSLRGLATQPCQGL
jgi:hypothetical protein